MKYLILISLSFIIGACSSTPKSAYESGWDNEISENTYKECSPVWLNKDMFVSKNLNRLVKLGYLNSNQAERVKENNIRVGDPECAAYAANGLIRSNVTITRNKNGQLTSKGFGYSCKNSQAKCPGVFITVSNGRITNIQPLAK